MAVSNNSNYNESSYPPGVMEQYSHDRTNIAGAIKDITGLACRPINTDQQLWIHESDENGTFFIRITSQQHMEEDLSCFSEDNEFVLPLETHKELCDGAVTKTVSALSQYLRHDIVTRAFPTLDIGNPGDFDPRKARIKFILLDEVHARLYDSTESEQKPNYNSAFTRCLRSLGDSPYTASEWQLNLSPNFVVFAREVPAKSWPKGYKPTPEEIKAHLEHRLVHEVLHIAGVADFMPNPLREAITELYALAIVNGVSFNSLSFEQLFITAGYMNLTMGTSLLIKSIETDITPNILHAAFVSGDSSALEELTAVLRTKLGDANLRRLLNFEFENSRDYLFFVRELLSIST